VDALGQTVPALPASVGGSQLELFAQGCVSAIPVAAFTGSAVLRNVTISGAPGSQFELSFVGFPSGLVSNQVVGAVGRCGAGYSAPDPSLPCGRCERCADGTYNVNANGVCVACAQGRARCSGPLLWAEVDNWVLFDNATRSMVVAACAPRSCLAACNLSVGLTAGCPLPASPLLCIGNATTAVLPGGEVGTTKRKDVRAALTCGRFLL
jgi:hypothetical protein